MLEKVSLNPHVKSVKYKMSIPLPIYTRISKNRVKCSICGKKMICRKLTRSYIERAEVSLLGIQVINSISTNDWVCCVCESDYILGKYARNIYEG